METVHLIVGVAVLGTNLGAGVWGAVAWLRQQPKDGPMFGAPATVFR